MISAWFAATRPKTLPAGIAPVAVGTALAGTVQTVDWLVAGACLAGSLLIQIGCNLVNDACDGLRGADPADRAGPRRAVASGLIRARAMLIGAALVLLLALVVGLWLAQRGGWPVLILGLVSIACAILYTAGPAPLAYLGLGDPFVLVFFGWFAVLGSAWCQVAPEGGLPLAWWLVASAIGLQATAILAVNNLRDLATDARVGKRTLCVRLGDRASRLYLALLHLAAAICLALAARLMPTFPLLWLGAGLALIGGLGLTAALARKSGPILNVYLARHGLLELGTGATLVLAFSF